MKLIFATFAAVGMLTSSALAGEPAQTEPAAAATSAAPAAVADPGDKMVCRVEEETGSRVRAKRICKTARQWDQIARATKDSWRKSTNRASAGQGGQTLCTRKC